MGEPLYSTSPTDRQLEDLERAKAKYLADSNSVDNIVWYGRRTAYPGFYRRAIDIYTRGIERFPEAAELYRHRGHRYITLRQFDKAVADFERAAELIEGSQDVVEADGLPNARNIPLTTLQSNIWYHLGLAYYLQQDWPNALRGFTNCREMGLNDDNLVSSTHWMYMILRRMGNDAEAEAVLSPIHDKMDIIENHSYYKLCRFYQGKLAVDDLIDPEDSASGNDAVRYGVANWYYYNEDYAEARKRLTDIVKAGGWNSFGHIAAEADYVSIFIVD